MLALVLHGLQGCTIRDLVVSWYGLLSLEMGSETATDKWALVGHKYINKRIMTLRIY